MSSVWSWYLDNPKRALGTASQTWHRYAIESIGAVMIAGHGLEKGNTEVISDKATGALVPVGDPKQFTDRITTVRATDGKAVVRVLQHAVVRKSSSRSLGWSSGIETIISLC